MNPKVVVEVAVLVGGVRANGCALRQAYFHPQVPSRNLSWTLHAHHLRRASKPASTHPPRGLSVVRCTRVHRVAGRP